MAVAKKTKAPKKPKVQIRSEAVWGRKDQFARSNRKTLALAVGQFKRAPVTVSEDVSNVAGQLQAQMSGFFAALKETPETIGQMFLEAVGGAFGAIQDRTPVDAGNARSGWQLVTVVDSVREKHLRIINIVPYVAYLEYGWSKQAPAGMVRITLLELERRMRQATEAYFRAD